MSWFTVAIYVISVIYLHYSCFCESKVFSQSLKILPETMRKTVSSWEAHLFFIKVILLGVILIFAPIFDGIFELFKVEKALTEENIFYTFDRVVFIILNVLFFAFLFIIIFSKKYYCHTVERFEKLISTLVRSFTKEPFWHNPLIVYIWIPEKFTSKITVEDPQHPYEVLSITLTKDSKKIIKDFISFKENKKILFKIGIFLFYGFVLISLGAVITDCFTFTKILSLKKPSPEMGAKLILISLSWISLHFYMILFIIGTLPQAFPIGISEKNPNTLIISKKHFENLSPVDSQKLSDFQKTSVVSKEKHFEK